MMNVNEVVLYSTKNRVATISLNRPDKSNSFDVKLRKDLLMAIEKANNDNDVRVVIISGVGANFSAGADIMEGYEEFYETIEEQIKEEYKPFLMSIHNSPKIFISSVQGAAAGIGGALAMACDLGIMAEEAFIYQAFAPLGLVPDGGTCWHLVNQLGYKRALEMIVEAKKVPARTCLELGLVNHVVPVEKLAEETTAWAERLAGGAPISQKYTKKILQKAMHMTLSEVIDLEAKYQNIAITSEDTKEGVMAFLEKRKANFMGR